MIDEKRLAEIEAWCEAATPGPWFYDAICESVGCANGWIARFDPERKGDGELSHQDKDGDFCAHAREDAPDLVAEVRRLQARVMQLTAFCEIWHPVPEEGCDG